MKSFVLPHIIEIRGKKMAFAGFGCYPYDCIEKDKHPNAAIYRGNGAWLSQFDELFVNRDQFKDVYNISEMPGGIRELVPCAKYVVKGDVYDLSSFCSKCENEGYFVTTERIDNGIWNVTLSL